MLYMAWNDFLEKAKLGGRNSTKIRPTRTFADSAYFFHSSTLNQNFDLAKTLMSSKGLMLGRCWKLHGSQLGWLQKRCKSSSLTSFLNCSFKIRMSQLSPVPQKVLPFPILTTALSKKWPPSSLSNASLLLCDNQTPSLFSRCWSYKRSIFHNMEEKNKERQGKKVYTKGCVTIMISFSLFSNKARFMLYRNRDIGWSCLILNINTENIAT